MHCYVDLDLIALLQIYYTSTEAFSPAPLATILKILSAVLMEHPLSQPIAARDRLWR
jgi:hypothetical protein